MALQDFVGTIFKTITPTSALRALALEIGAQCPTYAPIADARLAEIPNEMVASKIAGAGEQRTAGLRSQVNTLVQFADRPFPIDTVCRNLISMGEWRNAVKIAVARARQIDPVNRAVTYVQTGNVAHRPFYEEVSRLHMWLFDNLSNPVYRKLQEATTDTFLSWFMEQKVQVDRDD